MFLKWRWIHLIFAFHLAKSFGIDFKDAKHTHWTEIWRQMKNKKRIKTINKPSVKHTTVLKLGPKSQCLFYRDLRWINLFLAVFMHINQTPNSIISLNIIKLKGYLPFTFEPWPLGSSNMHVLSCRIENT